MGAQLCEYTKNSWIVNFKEYILWFVIYISIKDNRAWISDALCNNHKQCIGSM